MLKSISDKNIYLEEFMGDKNSQIRLSNSLLFATSLKLEKTNMKE